MTSMFFLGTPLVVLNGGRKTTSSPIVPSDLPQGSYQVSRYNALFASVLAEVVCNDADVAEARAVALATPLISSELTLAEAEALINSGEYK